MESSLKKGKTLFSFSFISGTIHMTESKLIFRNFSVVIENCVICEKAIIRKGSVLKNCIVGPEHEVAENTNREKAHLTNSDGYMEIE